MYCATAQEWTNNERKNGLELSQAQWRDHNTVAGCPVHLSQIDKLFLMLVWLQLNLNEQDLAYSFDISVSSVSRVCTT